MISTAATASARVENPPAKKLVTEIEAR